MSVDETYVVYDSKYDEIISVHSTKHYAMYARQDAMKNARRKMGVVTDELELKGLTMRYVVETLAQAQKWLKDLATYEISH